MTAHILCDVHNNALSRSDSAAARAFDAIRRATALSNEREKLQSTRWSKTRFGVDGPMIERWLLRTAIGIANVDNSVGKWHLDGSPLHRPGPEIVRLAFGESAFEAPLGLYAAAAVGDSVNFADRLQVSPLFCFDQGALGYIFVFRGLRFVLWLTRPEPLPELKLPWETGREPFRQELHRHLSFVRWEVGGRLSHFMDFMWPGQHVPHWAHVR
jgi:hypothetical protein